MFGRYSQQRLASWYDMCKMTAAHPTLPIPSYVRVINDRGPFHSSHLIDVSCMAALKLGMLR